MISFNNDKCTGCGACKNICPKDCISLIENEEGFLHPIINYDKCVKCNKCSDICTINNEFIFQDSIEQQCYFAYNKNKKEILKSSSGGVFYIIAKEILKNNGVVFGAKMDSDMKVYHCMVDSDKKLLELLGSKYVQSDIGYTYKEVKKYLCNGKNVLYSGTPCQIAGLKMYLNKDYKNLITIDILCHGVPSQKMFLDHIKFIENKKNNKIQYYNFRNKKVSKWGDYKYCYKFVKKDKIYSDSALLDVFFNSFIKGYIFRRSCYICKYASKNREGDITLGDFWGVEKYYKNIICDNGISAVIINTNKGLSLFNNISDKIIFGETEIDMIANKNHSLLEPISIPKERSEIFNYIKQRGYSNWAFKYYYSRQYLFRKISSKIPIKIKKYIKNLYNVLGG